MDRLLLLQKLKKDTKGCCMLNAEVFMEDIIITYNKSYKTERYHFWKCNPWAKCCYDGGCSKQMSGLFKSKRLLQNCSAKNSGRAIIKFSNRKQYTATQSSHLSVKRTLKSLDPTELDFPKGPRIFINGSPCAYFLGLSNNCKKIKGLVKLVFF